MRIYLSGYPLPEFGGINNLILLNQELGGKCAPR